MIVRPAENLKYVREIPKYVDDDGNIHPFATRSHVLESLKADELEALQQKRKSRMKL